MATSIKSVKGKPMRVSGGGLVTVGFTSTPELYERLGRAAEADHRSLSGLIRVLLMDALDRRDRAAAEELADE